MGADLRSNAIDTSHALRTSGRATLQGVPSGRATQFTGRFHHTARLIARRSEPELQYTAVCWLT